jgi:DNA replication initiation complex subunit (GINS family)
LKKGANSSPERNAEYRKAEAVTQDIINIRLRKIVALASSPEQTNEVLNDLAKEERTLYNRLYTIIDEWKTNITKETNHQ